MGTTAMEPIPASKALDAYFLEARCKLLEVAAILDRIERGSGAESVRDDRRLAQIRQAIAVLDDAGTARAEKIQQIFSLEYDPDWEVPAPRYTVTSSSS